MNKVILFLTISFLCFISYTGLRFQNLSTECVCRPILQTAALDGSVKYAFGGNGLGSAPGNMLNNITFSKPLSTLEREIMLRCLSVPINGSGKATRKAIKINTHL